jgi:hypothetical protein
VRWHVDPRGACTDTGTIPSQNTEAAGVPEREPTKIAPDPGRAQTHNPPDSPLSTPRASEPFSMSAHYDSLRRSAIEKNSHPWRVGSFRLLIRSPMKSVDFGARDSGTVENVTWHHRYFSSAPAAHQELKILKGFHTGNRRGVERSRLSVQFAVQAANVSNGRVSRNYRK